MGHPNLCSRACHYFAAGSCANGEACQFCHLPHSKRPVRLDKANRALLRNMSFAERASLMLPIMKKKAGALGLSMEPIANPEKCVASEFPNFNKPSQAKCQQSKTNLKVFRDVLKFRNMNSFVTLLAGGADVS